MIDLLGHNKQFDNLFSRYNSSNLANSILIYGPKGIGKRSFVDFLIFRIINISFKENNLKHHLNLFYKSSHPNIKVINKKLIKKQKK